MSTDSFPSLELQTLPGSGPSTMSQDVVRCPTTLSTTFWKAVERGRVPSSEYITRGAEYQMSHDVPRPVFRSSARTTNSRAPPVAGAVRRRPRRFLRRRMNYFRSLHRRCPGRRAFRAGENSSACVEPVETTRCVIKFIIGIIITQFSLCWSLCSLNCPWATSMTLHSVENSQLWPRT